MTVTRERVDYIRKHYAQDLTCGETRGWEIAHILDEFIKQQDTEIADLKTKLMSAEELAEWRAGKLGDKDEEREGLLAQLDACDEARLKALAELAALRKAGNEMEPYCDDSDAAAAWRTATGRET